MKLPCDSYKIDMCLSGVCNVCVPLMAHEELEPIAEEPIEVPAVIGEHKRVIRERTL